MEKIKLKTCINYDLNPIPQKSIANTHLGSRVRPLSPYEKYLY